MAKTHKRPKWQWYTTLLGAILFSLVVGINTAAQPLPVLMDILPPFLSTGFLALAFINWALLYGKDILKLAQDGFVGRKTDKKHTVKHWLMKWLQKPAHYIGLLNTYVNGLGVLYGAIGFLRILQKTFGYASLMAMPFWLRAVQLIGGFGGGALAAGSLTYNSLFKNIAAIDKKLTSDKGLDNWTKAKIIAAVTAGVGLAAFNAMAGFAATNSLYMLFGFNAGLPALMVTAIALFNQVASFLATLVCATSLFLSFVIDDGPAAKQDKDVGWLKTAWNFTKENLLTWKAFRFLALGATTCAGVTYMIFSAILFDPSSPWLILGPFTPVFAAVATLCSAYFLQGIFRASAEEIWNLVQDVWYNRSVDAKPAKGAKATSAASVNPGIENRTWIDLVSYPEKALDEQATVAAKIS